MLNVIKKLDHKNLMVVGKLVLANAMSQEAFKEKYEKVSMEQLQTVLIDYFSNKKNVDFYAETVLKLLSKKGLAEKVDKKEDIISNIFIDFDIPFTKKSRQYINELHKNGVLDEIEEFIELEGLSKVTFDCVLYEMLFVADIENPVEAEKARLEAVLKIFRGEPINVR